MMVNNSKKKHRKRKKNSSSGSESGLDRKVSKKGGPDESQDGHISESSGEEPVLDVSEILSKANSILFEEHSVFDESADILNSIANMDPSIVIPSSSSSSSSPPTSESSPSNADLMACLKSLDSKMSTMNTKIETVERKLKKLDDLEKKVNSFEADVKKLWVHVADSSKELSEKFTKLDDRVDNVEFRDGQKESRIHKLEQDNEKLKDTISYLQSQSMRNNLIFGNITEAVNEKPAETETILRKFMVEKLKLAQEQVNEMKIERAHRMGGEKRDKDGHIIPRNIVCKFNLFKDREAVRQQRSELKETDQYMHEQFPPEVVAKRKKLIPHLIKAKEADKNAWISYDKLYIDGKHVKFD